MPLDRPAVSLLRRLPVFLFVACIATGSAQNNSRQAAIGAQLAETFRRTVTVIDCPVALRLINDLADRIAPQLAGDRPTFHFTLIADDNGDPTHKPYALPSGYIFVSARLILEANSESEVARLLARAMAQRFLTSKGGVIPVTWIPSFEPALNMGVPGTYRAQKDEIDRQADLDSLQALAAAGYDLTQSAQPTAGFLSIQRELERLVPKRKPPTLLPRKPPTLLR
jgi:hypothetical protein